MDDEYSKSENIFDDKISGQSLHLLHKVLY